MIWSMRLFVMISTITMIGCGAEIQTDKRPNSELSQTTEPEKIIPKTPNGDEYYDLALSYLDGRNGQKDLSSAWTYFELAAELGHVESQTTLGEMNLMAAGSPGLQNQDIAVSDAVKWLTLASENGDVKAQYLLGGMFLGGELIPQDKPKGMQLIERSANNGNIDAQLKLANMYLNGTDVPINAELSEKYFIKASEAGNPLAMFLLAEYTLRGEFKSKSKPEAAQLLENAAKLGHAYAQGSLGRLYGIGEGVPKNYIAAYIWLSIAASQSSTSTQLYKDNLEIIEESMTQADISTAQKIANRCYTSNYMDCE